MCLVCSEESDEHEIAVSHVVKNNIKENARKWVGLDTYNDVYDRVIWESEEELFVHHTCKLNIASKKRLGQAERRKEISNLNDCVVDMETESCITDEVERNRRWSRSLGPIHTIVSWGWVGGGGV